VTSISPLRTVFAGTPAFAVPALERLIGEGFAPVAAVTQPDRQAGRGRKMQSSPVKLAALAAGIAVRQPASLQDTDFCGWLRQLRPDLLVVVAFGQILPGEVLHIPAYGCWNIHASLLPRWRGAAPIQRAIEAGDAETGVCIMQMDAGLDTGAVLERCSTAILPDDTGGSLHDRLAELGAGALLDCVRRLQAGTLPAAVAQEKTGISYAAKLEKAEAELEWTADAATLARRVRAFNPWPMAWCDIGAERTRVTTAVAVPGSRKHVPGTVVYSGPTGIDIATANGMLRILRLQRPGGVELSAMEYLNAVKLPARLYPHE
jgi:methionyl-tRNA formyltransferase